MMLELQKEKERKIASVHGIYTNQQCFYCEKETHRSYYLKLQATSRADLKIARLIQLKDLISKAREDANSEELKKHLEEERGIKYENKWFDFVCHDCYQERRFLKIQKEEQP